MTTRLRATAIAVVLLAPLGATTGAQAAGGVDEVPAPPQTCGPETGMQGQIPAADQRSGRALLGYCRNMALLATTDVEAGTERGNVARLEDCVYSGTTDDPGLAVVDVSDPTAPRTVATFPGIGHTWDTLAVDEGRRILVAKTRMPASDPLGGIAGSAGFTVFSIGAHCADLTRRGTYDIARSLGTGPVAARQALSAHEFRVTPDGRAVVISFSIPDAGIGAAGTPSIVVADIRDLDAPQPLTTVDVSALLRARGVPAAAIGSHDFDFDPAGTRMYAGLFTGEQADASDNAVWRGTAILDLSRLWDEGEVGLVEVLPQVGGHTVRWARSGDRELLFTNTEFDCLRGAPVYAPAGVQIVDITDELAPRVIANPTLEANATPENCAATAADRTSIWAHFGNVDRRDGAALYFATWSSSGVRAFDVRDPERPVEVAYLNPAGGASAYSYPVYDPESRELVWGGPGAGVAIARLDRDVLSVGEGRALARSAAASRWARAGANRARGRALICGLGGDRLDVRALARMP